MKISSDKISVPNKAWSTNKRTSILASVTGQPGQQILVCLLSIGEQR